jgi:hypothetical protein
LNAGVGSYNSDSQWAFLRRHGTALEPDLVVLMYFHNDIDLMPTEPFDPEAATRLEGKSPPEIVKWTLGRSWLYRSFVHFGRYTRIGPATSQEAVLSSPSWLASADAVRNIARCCQSRGIPFVTFQTRMRDQRLSNATLVGLQRLASELLFPVIDTLPWFAGKDFADLTNSRVDPHPTSAGHAVFADGIAASLVESVIARAPHLPTGRVRSGSAQSAAA